MKILIKIKNFFVILFESIAEARMQKVKYELELQGYKWDGSKYVSKNQIID